VFFSEPPPKMTRPVIGHRVSFFYLMCLSPFNLILRLQDRSLLFGGGGAVLRRLYPSGFHVFSFLLLYFEREFAHFFSFFIRRCQIVLYLTAQVDS